jgi:hypothetical protein
MSMLRRLVATITMAAIFFWAPSGIPTTFRSSGQIQEAAIGCIPVVGQAADTAFAAPPMIPCVVYPQPMAPVWPLIVGLASATSVIVSAFIVSRTQCRELSMQEAWSSIFLPFVGIAFNQQNNQCGVKPRHHH